jgi:hypothetical protein
LSRDIRDAHCITFLWKDYRAGGRARYKTMTLAAYKFMGRFLLHVLPGGSHRIHHYGLLANAGRLAPDTPSTRWKRPMLVHVPVFV